MTRLLRQYQDDEQEAKSLTDWLEHRLSRIGAGDFIFYTDLFLKMWQGSFGTTENIPTDFKQRVKLCYEATVKGREGDERTHSD